MNAIGWLRRGISAETVARGASERDVEVTPIGRFALRTPRPQGLLLGFAAFEAQAIRRGVERLALVLETSA